MDRDAPVVIEKRRNYYEIEFDIEWPEWFAKEDDRYDFLEGRDLAVAAAAARPSSTIWENGKMVSRGTSINDRIGGRPDRHYTHVSKDGQTAMFGNKARSFDSSSLTEVLNNKDQFIKLSGAFLSQDPQFEGGLHKGLVATINDLRKSMNALVEESPALYPTDEKIEEEYSKLGTELAEGMAELGDESLGEIFKDFAISEEEYCDFLDELIPLLEKNHLRKKDSFVDHLIGAFAGKALEMQDGIDQDLAKDILENEADDLDASKRSIDDIFQSADDDVLENQKKYFN